MPHKSPLPVRNGVNATRLRVPAAGPWPTIHEYVQETFGHIDPAGITSRFRGGEVVDAAGVPLDTTTPLGAAEFIWYYRSLPQEPPLPVQEAILWEDEHLLVVDKPHFLPTTPAGRYVQESLLVRLRHRLEMPHLVPIHRLDRGTAGVVIFAKEPQTRGAYQLLFENRRVYKTYECVSLLNDHPSGVVDRFPLTLRNRIEKTKGVVVSQLCSYDTADSGRRPAQQWHRVKGRRRTDPVPGANSSSRIELLHHGPPPGGAPESPVGLFRLTPHTGKTHQLRIHMAMLGLGVLHDRFYPELWDDTPDDFNTPLQLLARSLSFTDPLTGASRQFTSTRKLDYAPVTPDSEAS
ncbi:pseudouridine synthase [Nesterenkonia sphaerica]|uniref:RNA pseudouridylate synthase n=1 Tax=Nesterenkonia sphaerica TaxID=1804988 RepID=A0A5R9AD30_9MICC|nr:pseudouridine synthase [Nesterenkonia sphaerica]TLP75756.1 pseudouridine synthase [Nesterenkonia sphaerica]